MKRLTYFQVHKNKTPKKLPFFISRLVFDDCVKEMQHQLELLFIMQNENPF